MIHALALAIPLAMPATAPVPPAAAARPARPSPAEAAVSAVDQAFVAAFEREDAEAIARLYTEDAILMDPGPAMWMRGRDEIRQGLAAFFASVDGIDMELKESTYRVSGDVGYAAALFTIRFTDKTSGQKVEQSGRASSVLRKVGDAWLYAVDHASFPIPAPSPSPAPAAAKPAK